jgi:DNA polymerase III alpha subunit (gram-positive type)
MQQYNANQMQGQLQPQPQQQQYFQPQYMQPQYIYPMYPQLPAEFKITDEPRKNMPYSPYYSIDVEAVATGPRHNERAVAHVAVVDANENVLLNVYVKPEKKIFSCLTALTGVTREAIEEHGIPLSEAIALVKQVLHKDAILVGQAVLKDVQWMRLKDGEDFKELADLAQLWKVWNQHYMNWAFHSLQHKAKALLAVPVIEPHHPAMDALLGVRLYALYKYFEAQPNQQAMDIARMQILSVPTEPSFAKVNPVVEGACMGYKKSCKCGAPFFYG